MLADQKILQTKLLDLPEIYIITIYSIKLTNGSFQIIQII